MKITTLCLIIVCAGMLGSCAATVPKELVHARAAYQHASSGIAAEIAPAELHIAHKALTRAEQSFAENPESFQTRDLAYVAQRKSQLAEAVASISVEKDNQAQAKDAYSKTQTRIVAETKEDLSSTRSALADSERDAALKAEQLAAAEKRAADAQAALAKLAAVKDEPRGMVITLSGSVLFASNHAVLLPEAKARLDQVAAVLFTTKERHLTIEGHTDSQGTDSDNIILSQKRADEVRNYLIQRGYEADLIQANGLGEGRPVADNGNAEGRANNRRVEIVIARDPAMITAQ